MTDRNEKRIKTPTLENEIKVLVLGCKGAGKTSMLQALSKLSYVDQPKGDRIHLENILGETDEGLVGDQPTPTERFHELGEMANAGKKTTETGGYTQHRFKLRLSTSESSVGIYQLGWLDYPGEDLESCMKTLKPKELDNFKEYLRDCGVVLLLFAPDADVAKKKNLIEATSENFNTLKVALQKVKGMRGAGADLPRVIPVLTKADLVVGANEAARADGPAAGLKVAVEWGQDFASKAIDGLKSDYGDDFIEKISPVSVYGFDLPEREGDLAHRPTGFGPLLERLLVQIEASKKRRQKVLMAVVLAIVAMVVGGRFFWNGVENRRFNSEVANGSVSDVAKLTGDGMDLSPSNEKAVDASVDAFLQKSGERLSGTGMDRTQLKELQSKTRKWLEVKGHSKISQLEELRDQLTGKLMEVAYQAYASAKHQGKTKEAHSLGTEFITTYPDSPLKGDVKKDLDDINDYEHNRLISKVRGSGKSKSKTSLRKRLAAMRVYRNRYGTSDDLDKAIALGDQFRKADTVLLVVSGFGLNSGEGPKPALFLEWSKGGAGGDSGQVEEGPHAYVRIVDEFELSLAEANGKWESLHFEIWRDDDYGFNDHITTQIWEPFSGIGRLSTFKNSFGGKVASSSGHQGLFLPASAERKEIIEEAWLFEEPYIQFKSVQLAFGGVTLKKLESEDLRIFSEYIFPGVEGWRTRMGD
ncbi:MAG: hypothetical protein JKY61_12315 [Planctomycetes bacterium]|nr:hypothetical protein [Planctomycetota bacterium]